jgi:hypothetical protein
MCDEMQPRTAAFTEIRVIRCSPKKALTRWAIPGFICAMKFKTLLVTVALCLATGTACFAASAHIGTWKLSEKKSKTIPGMGKNTSVTYAEQGDKIKVTVDGIDKDGKATHGVWVGKFDGKAYRTTGNLAYDSIGYRVVNDRTNYIQALKDGKLMWSGTITVAKDGKTRTVMIHGTDANGKKFSSKSVYDKA